MAEGWRRGIHKSAALNLGDSGAQGTFGNVLGLSLVGITGEGGEVLLALVGRDQGCY